jgi:hypothetical protein
MTVKEFTFDKATFDRIKPVLVEYEGKPMTLRQIYYLVVAVVELASAVSDPVRY